MAQSVRVLLAERHQPIRELIIEELAAIENASLAGCVQSGADLEAFLENTHELPDIIILDPDIESDDAFELTKRITGRYPGIRVIALAESEESLCIRKLLESGASGVLAKESCQEGLSDCLANAGIQETLIHFEYTQNEKSKSLSKNDKGLDGKEREVLKLLMNQYSCFEISEKLNMENCEVQDALARLNKKTKADKPIDLKRYALRHAIY